MPMQNQLQEKEEVTRSSDSDLAETLRQSRPAKDEEGESHFFQMMLSVCTEKVLFFFLIFFL